MVCPNCGKSLRETAKFCSWCGEKLTDISADIPPAESIPEFTLESIIEETTAKLHKSVPEPVSEPISEPIPEEIVQESAPVVEAVPEPISEPVPEEIAQEPAPVVEAVPEPIPEPVPEKAVQEPAPAVEIVTETVTEPITESITKPIAKHAQEDTDEESAELAVEFNQSEDLFVVSRQPEPAVSETPEIHSSSYRSVRFSSRHGAAIFSAALIAVACISAIFFIPYRLVPHIKYKNAEELFHNGDYEAAYAEFSELGDYSESKDYLMKCRYSSAEQLMNAGHFSEAARAFSALEGYGDSDKLASDCLIHSAEQYIADGNYNAAVSAFYAAGRPELAENISRERAEAFAEAGDYFAAADVAEKYSREEAVEYIYLGSAKAMKEGSLKAAADGFAVIDGYKDSDELRQECLYGYYFEEYERNGASSEIVRGFYWLGDYMDSAELFIQSAYEYGKILYDDGNYYEAGLMFRNAGTYKDSLAMLYRSRYELGKLLEQSDPASAHSIFAMLGNYSDSAAKKRSTASSLGENGSDWYADGFTSVDGYCTSEFLKSDTLTVSCTAGTDAPSGPVTLVIIFMDGGDITVSADCENIRNSGSFSADIPLSAAAAGKAEVTVSVKESGKILRRFEITISE